MPTELWLLKLKSDILSHILNKKRVKLLEFKANLNHFHNFITIIMSCSKNHHIFIDTNYW